MHTFSKQGRHSRWVLFWAGIGLLGITVFGCLAWWRVMALRHSARVHWNRQLSSVAAVLLAIDPSQFLFTIVNSESIPTQTGECMLVSRVGDDFQILSPLQHPPTPALTVHIPWERAPLLGRLAVEGHDSFGASPDYRGRPILAISRHISGSVGLVRPIDQHEAFAPVHAQAVKEGLLALALIVMIGVGISAVRRAKHMRHLRELTSSEARLAGIISSAMDAIIVLDAAQRVTIFNAAAEQMFQCRAEEMLSQTIDSLLPERYRAAHGEHIRAFGRSPETARSMSVRPNLMGLRRNGEEFPIEASISKLRMEGQTFFSVMVRDITERKRAMQLLLETEEKYRALFEDSKDIVYISTPEGRLIDINQAGVEYFGYASKEELLKIDIAKDLYANPADREKTQQAYLSAGYVKDYEISLKRKDGTRLIALETSTAVRNDKGNFVAYRGILRDVTQQRHLERQLLQAQKMEAVGQLAGGIAHDFNNILTAITGYSDLMLMRLPESDPLHRNASEISKAATRASSLTRQLLAFSRRQWMVPKTIDLNIIIADLHPMLQRLIGEDVDLSTVLREKLDAVTADPSHIEQVIMNLVVNARDAMPRGGWLTIETENVVIDEVFVKDHVGARVGQYVRLTVSDSGQGMAPEVLSHVFEPFFTTKEVGKGTGLGLSTVYGIVKQSNGYITVQSEVGKGTCFQVYLPRTEKPFHSHEPREASSEVGRSPGTVLLVEDEDAVRSLSREVLRQYGFHVIEASNGEEALFLAEKHLGPIHLLVSDMVMPRMGGRELVERLVAVRPELKILFVSGYARDDAAHPGKLNPGATYLQKPFTPDVFIRTVQEVLSDSRPA